MPTDLSAIRMSTAAFEAIAVEAPRSADGRETGGALFGFDADIYGPTLITHASGPGLNAIRERDFFLRDLKHTESEAAATYADCCARWIGEWHTHPEGPPAPSKRDITSYLAHLHDPELNFETFVSLIVLPNDSHWRSATVMAWELDGQAMWMRPIDLTPEAELREQALQRADPPSEGENK